MFQVIKNVAKTAKREISEMSSQKKSVRDILRELKSQREMKLTHGDTWYREKEVIITIGVNSSDIAETKVGGVSTIKGEFDMRGIKADECVGEHSIFLLSVDVVCAQMKAERDDVSIAVTIDDGGKCYGRVHVPELDEEWNNTKSTILHLRPGQDMTTAHNVYTCPERVQSLLKKYPDYDIDIDTNHATFLGEYGIAVIRDGYTGLPAANAIVSLVAQNMDGLDAYPRIMGEPGSCHDSLLILSRPDMKAVIDSYEAEIQGVLREHEYRENHEDDDLKLRYEVHVLSSATNEVIDTPVFSATFRLTVALVPQDLVIN